MGPRGSHHITHHSSFITVFTSLITHHITHITSLTSLSPDSLDNEFVTKESQMTPMSAPGFTPRHSPMSSMTRIVKGRDGKAVVNRVVDVEADTLADEKDMFVLSDDEIDGDLHQAQETNVDLAKMSIKSNLSMRSSKRSMGN